MPEKWRYQKYKKTYKKLREKNREKQKKYYLNWYKKNGRNRAIDWQEAIFTWIKEHPKAYKAQWTLRNNVKAGKVKKPNICENCRREVRLYGHHPDYNKPLDVLWLCGSCHKILHFSP